MKPLGLLILAALLGSMAYDVCGADDGAIEAYGGSVAPMVEHPTIRLSAEFVHVRIRPDDYEVECVFFLENDGPAATVTMGFPNFSGGADVEAVSRFSFFVSFVDKDSVSVTLLPDSAHSSYGDYWGWYTKTVEFAEGQTRCVRNVYSSSPGFSASGDQWIEYVLWSGSTWAGPIGVADIVVTLDSTMVTTDSLSIEPSGYGLSPNEIRWHFTEFEPEGSSGNGVIRVSWRRKH